MGVDEFLVDPVTAGFGQFLYAHLAGGEHDLADLSVDLVAVEVDVGEVVVGTDFLNLAEGVLEGVPIPEADVLEGDLVVSGIGGFEGGLRRELVLHQAIEPVGLARGLNVESDVGLFAHQLVGFHDEAAHVPGGNLNEEIADQGGDGREEEPAHARARGKVDEGEDGAENERQRNQQQSAVDDVGIGVGDAAEDGVIFKQELETGDVDAHRDDEEQEGDGDGEGAPGGGRHAVEASIHELRTAGDEHEDDADEAEQDGQQDEPAYD